LRRRIRDGDIDGLGIRRDISPPFALPLALSSALASHDGLSLKQLSCQLYITRIRDIYLPIPAIGTEKVCMTVQKAIDKEKVAVTTTDMEVVLKMVMIPGRAIIDDMSKERH
jgi:hypothetical protein